MSCSRHPPCEFSKKSMGEIGNDEAHHVGATGNQKPRGNVRTIVELLAEPQNTRFIKDRLTKQQK